MSLQSPSSTELSPSALLLTSILATQGACAPATCELSEQGEENAHSVYEIEEVVNECQHLGDAANAVCVTENGKASILEIACDSLDNSYVMNTKTGEEKTGYEQLQGEFDNGADCWVTPLSADDFFVCEGATNTTILPE